jgi:hypothetical protein
MKFIEIKMKINPIAIVCILLSIFIIYYLIRYTVNKDNKWKQFYEKDKMNTINRTNETSKLVNNMDNTTFMKKTINNNYNNDSGRILNQVSLRSMKDFDKVKQLNDEVIYNTR